MRLSARLSAILGTRLPAAALLLGLGITMLGEMLNIVAERTGHPFAFFSAAGVVLVIIGLLATRRWLRPAEWEMARVTGHVAWPARWLVVTASPGRGIGSAVVAVEHHLKNGDLERVCVLHTDDEVGRGAFRRLRELLEPSGARHELFQPVPLDPGALVDPEPVVPALEQLFVDALENGVDTDEVVLDYTGGPKSFTAAMVLVGAAPGHRLQYIQPIDVDEHGRPAKGTAFQAVEVDLRYQVQAKAPQRG